MKVRRILWSLLALVGVVYTVVADRLLEYVIGGGMTVAGLAGLFLAREFPHT